MTTPAEFQELLDQPEGTNVEFNSAAGGFHFEELVKYCVALANEGGGTIVLGVTDQRPSEVVGTRAFAEPGRSTSCVNSGSASPRSRTSRATLGPDVSRGCRVLSTPEPFIA